MKTKNNNILKYILRWIIIIDIIFTLPTHIIGIRFLAKQTCCIGLFSFLYVIRWTTK